MVIGENQPTPAAIVVPDFNHLRSWCEVKEILYTTNAEMIAMPRIRKRFEKEITHYNKRFGKYERVSRFEILDHEWGVETGQLSATLKLRRTHLLNTYADVVERLYRKNGNGNNNRE